MRPPEVASLLVALSAGRTSASSAAAALGVAEERLAVYARGARALRERALAGMFPHVCGSLGEPRWSEIVEAYFAAHPMRCFELGPDFVSFPAFAATYRELPEWLSDLAGFELEEWEAPRRARSPKDDEPDRGPLRVCSTVVLQEYRYDFVRWIDDLGRAGEPAARACTCVFWQDRDAESFRNVLEAAELAALTDPQRADMRVLAALREADLILGAP